MQPFIVRPDAYRQFGERNAEFCLVTEDGNTDKFTLGSSTPYLKTSVWGLRPAESLEAFLDERCPEHADVLVVCPDTFLASPSPSSVGARKIGVMPCASTGTTHEQVSYLLGVAERTDPEPLSVKCAAMLAAIEEVDALILRDEAHGAEATFDPWGDYEWNQQAGYLQGGDQQLVPAGKLSALAGGVLEFDGARRLLVNGSVALKGAPVVHRGADAELVEPQRRLFERLDQLRRGPVVLEFVDGLVSEVHPTSAETWTAAEALNEMMCRDDRYRVLWEFGIGLNEVMEPVAGNCGLNEVYGGQGGALHLGFGLTPATPLALAVLCPGTTVRAGSTPLARARSHRTLNRRKAASCGCS